MKAFTAPAGIFALVVTLALALALALALTAPAPGARAAEPSAAGESPPVAAEEPWSADMVDDLMSPYCPGRTLRNCPSPQAGELIGWIETQEEEGRDPEAVYQQLLSEFGEEIRQAPPARGFGVAAYAIPVLALLAGGALVAVFLRRQGAAAASVEPTATPAALDPELERLVDEELGRTP